MILFLIVPYTLVFMRGAIRNLRAGRTNLRHDLHHRQFLDFVSNRNIFCLIVFSSLPAAIALVGFLSYFIPVYLNRIGTTQSNIGRVLMVYGVCLIYLAPLISKYIDAGRAESRLLLSVGLRGAGGRGTFTFTEGLRGSTFRCSCWGFPAALGLHPKAPTCCD